MKAALSLLFVSALIVAGCKITDPNETPATPPTLKILPDTARGTTMQWINFRALWSDSANHARYYFWDFGDSTTVTTSATVAGHTYLNAGEYHLHLLALDARDSVVGSANSVTVIGRMPITVALDSDSYTIDHDGSYTFHATLTPAMYNVQYVWTLVNDTTVSTGQANSVNLNFTKTGPYVLRVDVVSNGATIASDTANVTVTYPTVTADELAGMGSLEVFLSTDSLHTFFSLIGGPGNTVARTGNDEAVTNYSSAHFDLGSGRSRDTSGFRRVSWRLAGDHFLDSVKLTILDSTRIGSIDTAVLYVWHASFEPLGMRLVSRTSDAIEFDASLLWDLDIGSDTTHFPTPHSFGSGCDDVRAIRFNNYRSANVKLIFHPAR